MRTTKAPWLALVLAFAGGALSVEPTSTQAPVLGVPQKILFVGNSFTYWHDGIYTHFEKLAASSTPPLRVTTDKAVQGGAFLKVLWELKTPVLAISTGAFDVVVLQDDIPETNADYFRQYAKMFIEEVRRNKARPVLYMAWAYERLGWISMAEIAEAHKDLASQLNVDVAPVGLAWLLASKERPRLALYDADREHPSIQGMYLATCVVYATVYAKDPGGLAYAPPGVTADEAAFLQRIAWRTLNDYRAGRL